MIEGIYSYGLSKIDEIQFIRNECKGSISDDKFDFDDRAYHVIVYEDSHPIAVGRSISKGHKEYLDHIYVLSQKQRQGIGDLVVKMLLDKAFRLGAQQVFVQSPLQMSGFFISIGFEIIEEIDDYVNMVIQPGMIRKCKN